jgi:MFS family permease
MTKTALGAGAAAMNAAMAVSSAAGTLVVGDRLALAWAALPATAGILGTGLGSIAVATRIARTGHRRGLAGGYAVGTLGGAVCVAATWHGGSAGSVPALVVGLFLLGIGNASGQLSRYVAAELAGPAHRASAIAVVVWIATVGAVGGPALLGPSGHLATSLGAAADAGPFLLAAVATAAALAAMLAVPLGRPATLRTTASPRVFERPAARRALAAMAGAQVIMVAVMTAAPMNMHMHGSAPSSIGAVLSAHTFGMFAFSPLTGAAVQRFGPSRVVRVGLAVMVLSSAAATITASPGQPIALLLLGYGWNLCFISGSSLLAGDLDLVDRLAVEGRVDATVWAFAAGAGLLSTVLLSAGGTALLAGFAAAVAVTPYLALRRSLAST